MKLIEPLYDRVVQETPSFPQQSTSLKKITTNEFPISEDVFKNCVLPFVHPLDLSKLCLTNRKIYNLCQDHPVNRILCILQEKENPACFSEEYISLAYNHLNVLSKSPQLGIFISKKLKNANLRSVIFHIGKEPRSKEKDLFDIWSILKNRLPSYIINHPETIQKIHNTSIKRHEQLKIDLLGAGYSFLYHNNQDLLDDKEFMINKFKHDGFSSLGYISKGLEQDDEVMTTAIFALISKRREVAPTQNPSYWEKFLGAFCCFPIVDYT